MWPVISTVLLKLNDLSRSKLVTYTVKVVIQQKEYDGNIILESVQDRCCYYRPLIGSVMYDLLNNSYSDDLE